MAKLNLTEGKLLIDIARKSIEGAVDNKKYSPSGIPEKLKEPAGVFVTLYEKTELRGCIGFIMAVKPMAKAIHDAAISAAFRDPRFPPVKKEEVKDLRIEISVLTKPAPLTSADPKDRAKEIKVGRDGLIVEYGPFSGLLLPQVATESKWDEEMFLGKTCWKAGLEESTWLDPSAKFSKFECQIFAEKSPKGEVVEEKL
jgi:uncharacterized protein (TIGR00296 family)